MCFECSGWYPLGKFGADVLGINSSLPLWIAASHRNILYDIIWETLKPGCGLAKRGSYQTTIIGGICQKGFEYDTAYTWLETNNANYAKVIRAYRDYGFKEWDDDWRRMVDLRGMFTDIRALRMAGQELPAAGFNLWGGPDQQEISLRVGKIEASQAALRPEYLSSTISDPLNLKNEEVRKFIFST